MPKKNKNTVNKEDLTRVQKLRQRNSQLRMVNVYCKTG